MKAVQVIVHRPNTRIALPARPRAAQIAGKVKTKRAMRTRRVSLRMEPLPPHRKRGEQRLHKEAPAKTARPAHPTSQRDIDTKPLRMEFEQNERNNMANTLQYGGQRPATGRVSRVVFDDASPEQRRMDFTFSNEIERSRRSGMEYAADRIEIAAAEMARLTNALERAARRERA